MGKRNRVCYLCGTKYEYCPTCTQDKAKPAFMSEFHAENCKNIFEICTRFNMKFMSKVEAQEALAACDLSGRANFRPFVQRDLDNIFAVDETPVKAEEPKPRRGKRAKLPVVDETMDIPHEVVYTEE